MSYEKNRKIHLTYEDARLHRAQMETPRDALASYAAKAYYLLVSGTCHSYLSAKVFSRHQAQFGCNHGISSGAYLYARNKALAGYAK